MLVNRATIMTVGLGEMKGTLSRQSRRFLRILRRDRRPLRSVDVSWGGSVRVGMG